MLRIPTSCSINSLGCGRTPLSSGCATPSPLRTLTAADGSARRSGKPIQQADFFGNGTPAVRERKRVGDLRLICQMLSGCSTTAAAYLAGQVPADEDGTHFLLWFMTWQEEYMRKKRVSFGAHP